jgi:hypothetical protein
MDRVKIERQTYYYTQATSTTKWDANGGESHSENDGFRHGEDVPDRVP